MKRPKPSRPTLENETLEGGTAATVRVATEAERECFDILANLGLVRSALLALIALLPDHFPHLSLPHIKERLYSRPAAGLLLLRKKMSSTPKPRRQGRTCFLAYDHPRSGRQGSLLVSYPQPRSLCHRLFVGRHLAVGLLSASHLFVPL